MYRIFPVMNGPVFPGRSEAVLFHVVPPAVAFQALAHGATTAFTITALLALAMNRKRIIDDPRNSGPVETFGKTWTWKLVMGACIYFVLYFVAGIAVHPFIKSFYSDQWLPSLGELCAIQFFRGLLYIAIALPFIRRMTGRRLHAGLVLGLCFSVLGGIAPLLLPNPYMPVPIQIAHSIEVGISNFIYGLVVAYLLVPRRVLHNASLAANSGGDPNIKERATI
ncbi:MAG: hypothetical protein M3Y72_05475 [Acidobacteriota bacterium]|nr:hypothetical protein [Acidobacteriota bacterium]